MGLRTFFKDLFARRVEVEQITDQDILIVVIGPTGAGKSSFINTATKASEVSVNHGLASCTGDVQSVKCTYPGDRRRRNVVFVDTPAFNHDVKTVNEIGRTIRNWQKKTYARKNQVAGILYIHRISDLRITESPVTHLSMFQEACGAGSNFRKVLLVTTMWDTVDPAKSLRREEEMRTKYWKSMMDLGSGIVRFENTAESAWHVIDLLLEGQ